MTPRGWTGLAIVIVMVRAASAGPPSASVRANPQVRVVEVSVPGGGNATLTLHNDGDAPVTIEQVTRDASCDPAVTASTGGVPFTIADGGMNSITINCATAMPAGIKRCVFHGVDSSDSSLVDFEGVCRYGSAALLTPSASQLAYADTAVGATTALPLQLTNTSTTPIEQLFLHIDDLEGNFRIAAPCNPNVRACDPVTAPIGEGASVALTIQCTPQSAGVHTAKLYVVGGGGQHLTGSPAAVDLSCTGTATASPAISISPGPVLAQPTSVIGLPVTSIVHLSNVGGAPLAVTSINIIDAGSGASSDWSYDATGACFGTITPGVACTLDPGDRVDLSISFKPLEIARRDAMMLISFVDTAPRSMSLALRGEGRGATVELIGPPSIDFGRVPLGAMPQTTFLLANHGNQDVSNVELAIAPASGTPFTLTPPAMTSIIAGGITMVSPACKPTNAGQTTATFEVTAADAFDSAPIAILATCEGSSLPLSSNPTTIRRGELRTGTSPAPTTIALTSSAASQMITSIALESPSTALSLTGAQTPVSTPHSFQLHIATTTDAELANAIIVTSATGDELRIPIAGSVRTAALEQPLPTSLGTFCVNQPTTPRQLSLTSSGTAAIRVVDATLALGTASPFDLIAASPSLYPATLEPEQQATVELTPRRQATAGVQTDDVVWTTDLAPDPVARATISATFVENGGAIAPPSLAFGPSPVHLVIKNGQTVTLQNCDTTDLTLDPQITAPFTIESPSVPDVLAPNEIVTISIGFHPTRVGAHSGALTIHSPQLSSPLVVMLSGDGVANNGGGPDAGVEPPPLARTSFYACDGCGSNRPSGVALLIIVVAGALLRPRSRTGSA